MGESPYLVYTNELKIWFLSAPHPEDDASSGTPGWSLAPDAKICAASLKNSQILISFVYIAKKI